MKALSVRQPFADDIAIGEKNTEYRSWSTKHRGDLLICSTAGSHLGKDKKFFVNSHALCVVSLDDVEKTKDGYAWYLSNIRPIKPFYVKGKLHLFDVDETPFFIQERGDSELFEYWLENGFLKEEDFENI